MRHLEKREREDRALSAFCMAFEAIARSRVVLLCRPDRRSPDGSGCDGIVWRKGREVAIEHTSLDSFPDQRLDAARLIRGLEPVTAKIALAFPEHRISIGVPIGAVQPGQPWDTLRDLFAHSVISALRKMPDESAGGGHDLPGLFEITLFRRKSAHPGCYLSRHGPEDGMSAQTAVLSRLIESKAIQLQPYRDQGLVTVLLLDFDDIASAEGHTIAESFRQAAVGQLADGLDEVYLVDSTEAPPWIYPVKLQKRVFPNLPEFEQWFEAQYRRTYEGN